MTTNQPIAHPRCEEQQRPATIPTPTQHCGGCPMSCWILGPSPYMDPGLPWGGMGDEFPILYIIYPPATATTANDNNKCHMPPPLVQAFEWCPPCTIWVDISPGGWV